MKTPPRTRKSPHGFVSYTVVLAIGAVLTILTFAAFKRSITNQQVSGQVQLRNDYIEKEDTVIRTIVASTPNRAIRAMQRNSNQNGATRAKLNWTTIFNEALDTANARTSISPEVASKLGLTSHQKANTGDTGPTGLATIETMFTVSSGLNSRLGANYPVPLSSSVSATQIRDNYYPIISKDKIYGSHAESRVSLPVSSYPNYNLIPYPNINFGYAKPGDLFVAKRNWWSLTLDLANHDAGLTKVAHRKREFVLSLYEIPSQLAISASSFLSLGEFASGQAWDADKVNIQGGVFAGKAEVSSGTSLESVSGRRGMSLGSTATIGGNQFAQNPFTPGIRENFQITKGAFFPVSLASESGRVAFVPINRNEVFFDRFHTDAQDESGTTLSPTTWNDYTIGARQTAMQLDITEVTSSTNKYPTRLRFSYLVGGVRQFMTVHLNGNPYGHLPPGYTHICNENQSHDFGTQVVDLAYGGTGNARVSTNPDVYQNTTSYAFENNATGRVTFNNARFGDPLYGVSKKGYYRPSPPWGIKLLASGQICVAFYPERLPAFLAALGADPVTVNNSVSVNVDYSTATGSVNLTKPNIPCTINDYGLILQECEDLSPFTKGFSLVTNLRMYIGEDFNTKPTTPPAANWPLLVGTKKYPDPGTEYLPPCSLFAPEKRYGVDVDPRAVNLAGQMGSLADENTSTAIRPLDSKTLTGTLLESSNVTVNLRPIQHPADLPPICMMNWLVVIEELRPEFSH